MPPYLDLKSRVSAVRETKSGESHTVTSGKNQEAPACKEKRQTSGFEAVSTEEKSNIEKVLFLLDKFCVRDSFYHELTMTINGLPKSFALLSKGEINYIISVILHTLPVPQRGAQVLFSDLLKERLKDYLVSHPDGYEDTIRIKMFGDGARMTRNSSFIFMSFALLDLGDDVMTAQGNHTIAVVKGKENYKTLQESFADVFNEINRLNSEEKIEVSDRVINLEFFLWG